MKRMFLTAVMTAASLSFAACGGGGGGGSMTPPVGPTGTPTPNTSSSPGSTTNASGTIVNDQTGAPLAGVTVKLMPFGSCGPTPAPTSITPENDGCPTPLPSPQATTAANGTFTLNGAPNGKYILIAGTDAVVTPPPGYAPSACVNACGAPSPAPFTTTATVHDVVTLTGGNQTLQAPNIASILTTAGGNVITPQAWETNGDYRIATLDAQVEMPCLIAWQYQRAQHGLAGSSADEWALEAARDTDTYQMEHNSGLLAFISTGNVSDSGGVSCDVSLITASLFSNAYSTDPRTLWFGGNYYYDGYNGWNIAGSGYAIYPIDPRSFTDPNHVWP